MSTFYVVSSCTFEGNFEKINVDHGRRINAEECFLKFFSRRNLLKIACQMALTAFTKKVLSFQQLFRDDIGLTLPSVDLRKPNGYQKI